MQLGGKSRTILMSEDIVGIPSSVSGSSITGTGDMYGAYVWCIQG